MKIFSIKKIFYINSLFLAASLFGAASEEPSPASEENNTYYFLNASQKPITLRIRKGGDIPLEKSIRSLKAQIADGAGNLATEEELAEKINTLSAAAPIQVILPQDSAKISKREFFTLEPNQYLVFAYNAKTDKLLRIRLWPSPEGLTPDVDERGNASETSLENAKKSIATDWLKDFGANKGYVLNDLKIGTPKGELYLQIVSLPVETVVQRIKQIRKSEDTYLPIPSRTEHYQ